MSTNIGSYNMQLNQLKKEMNVKIVGNFTPQQAQQFIDDYMKNVKSINPNDFVLVIDCTDMNVITQDLIPALRDCYALYKSSDFKTVKFMIADSAIIKMQLARIAREVGLTNAEFESVK